VAKGAFIVIARNGIGLVLVSLLVLPLAAGCSSDKTSKGEKIAQSFERTKMSLYDAQQKVDNSLMTMDQMQFTGNLNNFYSNYKAAVADLEKTGKDAGRRAESMKVNADEYIKNWEKDVAEIKDPTAKASMEDRRNAVDANYAKVSASAQNVKDAYDPFIADHRAIMQALGVNLSQATLASLKPVLDRTHADGKTLKAKIAVFQTDLDNIERGGSSK
jgi:hypothetical protein